MKKIGSKIALAIVAWSIIITLVISSISLIKSSTLLQSEAKDKLKYMVQSEANSFSILTSRTEGAVEDLASTSLSQFDLEKAKNDTAYMEAYQSAIEPMIKRFSETTEGTMGTYIYFNPEITKGMYGAWFADTEGKGTFDSQELGTLDDFKKTDSKEMAFYFEAMKAKKGVWLDPYYDEDLKKKVITYSKPVYFKDTLIAVIGIDITFSKFEDKIKSIKAYETGRGILLSSKYDFLADVNFKQEDNLSKIENGTLKFVTDKMGQVDSDVMPYIYKNQNQIIAYSKVSNGQIVAISVPESEIYSGLNKLTALLYILLISSILISILISLFLARVIANPIKKITELINKTADLQFNHKDELQTLLKNKDEIGTMAKAINKMNQALRDTVENLIEATRSINKNSKLVDGLTNDLTAKADETLVVSTEISAGMEQTAASAEEINASIQEICTAVNSISEKALEGAHISIDVNERADKLKNDSLLLSENARKVCKEVKTEVERAIENSKAVAEIDSMAAAILQITKQTNLLALNASIEAARAGEAGKGFSVVAEEIKKLAEQSSTTVGDIQRIITLVNSSVDDLSNSSKKVLEFVDKEVQQEYENSIKNAEQYCNDAQIFNALMTTFSSTAEELNASISTISQAINEVTQTVEQGADGIGIIADKTDSNVNKIHEVKESTLNNMESVDILKKIVSRFKI